MLPPSDIRPAPPQAPPLPHHPCAASPPTTTCRWCCQRSGQPRPRRSKPCGRWLHTTRTRRGGRGCWSRRGAEEAVRPFCCCRRRCCIVLPLRPAAQRCRLPVGHWQALWHARALWHDSLGSCPPRIPAASEHPPSWPSALEQVAGWLTDPSSASNATVLLVRAAGGAGACRRRWRRVGGRRGPCLQHDGAAVDGRLHGRGLHITLVPGQPSSPSRRSRISPQIAATLFALEDNHVEALRICHNAASLEL